MQGLVVTDCCRKKGYFFFSLQPNHPEHAPSHLISEAKQGQGLVSKWMGEAYLLKKINNQISVLSWSNQGVISNQDLESQKTDHLTDYFFQRQPVS